VEFRILGPLEVRRDGEVVAIGAAKQRALLVHLLLRVGRVVPVERLIDGLWGEDPPAQARATVRSYVSHLRRALEGTDRRQPIVLTRANGYVLGVDPAAVDAVRFERLAAAARRHLDEGRAQEALDALGTALGLWRGQALADVADAALVRGDITRLEELRRTAEEDRFEALLALGLHADAVPELDAFTAQNPLRERPRAQRMLALYRSGRAPEALQAYRDFRDLLVDDLGLDPSPDLQQLADDILNQSAALAVPTLDPPTEEPTQEARTRPGVSSAAAAGLVGRAHERAELRRAVERLRAGQGGLLLLVGEPGIGKTTMLHDLAAAAAGAVATHWGRCHETAGAPPFWPWTQVARSISRELDDRQLAVLTEGRAAAVAQIADDIARRLSARPPPPGDDLEAARFQLYEGVAEFLLRAAASSPLLLCLDDIHWADTPSLQLLGYLATRLAGAPLLVAAAFRDVPADQNPELETTLAAVAREPAVQQLGLGGLLPEDVAELASRAGGTALPSEAAELLHQRTGGNPFFVTQLTQLARESHDAATLPVPPGVRHIITSRLGMLAQAARELLEAASVAGRTFDVRWLAPVIDATVETALELVEAGLEHGLVEAVGRPVTAYRFVHALIRETVYGALSPARAARLHAAVGQELEGRPNVPVQELAEHFWQASDLLDDDRPLRYLLAAAHESLARLALEDAERAALRALDIAVERGDPSQETEVLLQVLLVLFQSRGWAAPSIGPVVARIERLARQADVRPEVAPLFHLVWQFHHARGDHAAARRSGEEHLQRMEGSGDSAALAMASYDVGFDRLLHGDQAAALEHAARGLAHADAAPPERLTGMAESVVVVLHGLRGLAHATLGQRAEAIGSGAEAGQVAAQLGAPFPRAHAAIYAAWSAALVGELDLAHDLATEARTVAEAAGFLQHVCFASILLGWIAVRRGEPAAQHLPAVVESEAALQAASNAYLAAARQGQVAEVHLAAGDVAGARYWMQQARAALPEGGTVFDSQLDHVEQQMTTILASG
jgi:DNA-binding SARP family transcriptional activator